MFYSQSQSSFEKKYTPTTTARKVSAAAASKSACMHKRRNFYLYPFRSAEREFFLQCASLRRQHLFNVSKFAYGKVACNFARISFSYNVTCIQCRRHFSVFLFADLIKSEDRPFL